MLETPPPQREGISVSEKDVPTLNNYAEEKLQETTQLSEAMSKVLSIVKRRGIYIISAVLGFTAILLYFGKIPGWVNARGKIVPEVAPIPILAKENGIVTKVLAQVNQQLPKNATLLQIKTKDSNINEISNIEKLEVLQNVQKKELEILRRKFEVDRLEMQLKPQNYSVQKQNQEISNNYRNNFDILTKQIKSTQAEIEKIKTKIDSRANLTDETQITMPKTGTIQKLEVKNPGQSISKGTLVATVIPTENSFIIQANISERDISSIEAGMEATIKIDAYNFHEFGSMPAKVNQIIPDMEQPGNFIVTLDLIEKSEETEMAFFSGLNVQVEIQTKEQRLYHLLFGK